MILIINICKEPLHHYEFVKPIEDILSKNKIKFFTRHYKKLKARDIEKADKIIITGTSLADNDFLEDLEKFSWINDFKKPVFGICGGSHILGLVFGENLKKNLEVGLKSLVLKEDFLGKKKGDLLHVYHLHGWSSLPEIFHRDNYYATTFHPEVRNKDLILEFAKL